MTKQGTGQCREAIATLQVVARACHALRPFETVESGRRPVLRALGFANHPLPTGQATTALRMAGLQQAQRLYGNRAVQRLVQRLDAAPGGRKPGGLPAHAPEYVTGCWDDCRQRQLRKERYL